MTVNVTHNESLACSTADSPALSPSLVIISPSQLDAEAAVEGDFLGAMSSWF